MKGLRVIGVIPGSEEWTAAFSFSKRQMESMSRVGCEVELFFLKNRRSPRELFRERKNLRTLIREFQPDLVHAHFGTMTAFFCATASHVPLVVSFRGSDLNPAGEEDRGLRWVLGYLLSQIAALRARSIICVSRGVRSRLWWNKKGSYVIPTGVDVNLFQPIPLEKARKRMGWGMDERIVLFSAGVSAKNKGIDLVQLAVKYAENILGNIRLKVMDGSMDPDEVPWAMNAADCLIFASRYEGSPNVVKEAIACNLPLVSVDVGDVCEQLDGVSPSVVAARDPQAMGGALVELLKRSERSNGHLIIERISQETIARKIMTVYKLAVRQ